MTRDKSANSGRTSQRPSVLAWLGVALCAFFVVRHLLFRAPTEAEMLTKFHQHRAQFEQLRLMLQRDKNVKIISEQWVEAKYGFTKEGDGHQLPLNVSSDRIALYRPRLKELGFSDVISDRGRIRLAEFGGGFGGDTWSIGYVWSDQTPSPLVKSAYSQRPMRDTQCFSRIQGDWYLYQRR